MNEENENYDYCYECGGYGDDTCEDEEGNLISACAECPHSSVSFDD